MTVHLAILRAAALLVPRRERMDWMAEWRSELWYVRAARHRKVTAFCLGAFPDALWLRRNLRNNDLPLKAHRAFNLQSPLRCAVFLAILAGASFWSASHTMGFRGVGSLTGERHILAHLLAVLYALLVLPVTTSLDFGEYPANGHPLSWVAKRWMFFATKVIFLLSTVFCGGLTLMAVGATPILGQTLLAGYVLAFRWALIDQRRRCPICLHELTNPVRIGESSHTFLAWYGTELICAKGHGVLHIPEIPTSCYRTQRWLDLEPHAST